MNYGKAFLAGSLGALVMTGLMIVARALALTTLNLEMALGSFLTEEVSSTTWWLGLMIHVITGGVLAQFYAAGFEFITHRANAWIGAGFSLIHTIIAGGFMAILGSIHPLMKSGQIQAPGPFTINYGMITAVAFVALHVIYGAWVGGMYTMGSRVSQASKLPRAA
jgi:hypothetical protein